MKKFIRIMLLTFAASLMLLISGCSGTFGSISINTTLTVDKSFDGSRVMTAQIPSGIYKSVFGSDVEKIEELIKKHSPGDMYCVASLDDSGNAQIRMQIDFASLSEYQKKLQTICSGNNAVDAVDPVVKYDYSKSILKSGYTISENFTSLDLFYWLSDAISEEYPSVKKSDTSDIFKLGTTSLVLDGAEIDLGGSDKIQASDIESHAFDGINIDVTVNSDGTIDSNIRYCVSSEVAKELGDKLDTMMKELVPKNGTLSSSDSAVKESVYRIKFTSASSTDFITAMNKALGTNNTEFSVNTVGDDSSLSVKATYKMYFDGSYFLDYTAEDTNFAVVLNVPSNYSVESCLDKYGYMTGYDSTYSNNMCSITMELASPDQLTIVMGYIVDLDSINISTYVHNDIDIDRSISFKLTKEADTLIGKNVKSALDDAAKIWPDQMTVNTDKLISSVEYTISMNADSYDQINEMTRTILLENARQDEDSNGDGQPDNSKLSGGILKPTDPLKKYFQLADTVNFSKFLKGSMVSEGIQYQLTYPKHYKALFNGNTSFENAQSDGQTITCTSYNKVISVNSTAVKWNIEGICVLTLGIVSLFVFLLVLLLEYPHAVCFIKEGRIDVDGEQLFKGKGIAILITLSASLVCFVIMAIRLIFRIY